MNEFAVVLKSDFDKAKEIVARYCKIIEYNFLCNNIKEGYKEFYIGQKIKCNFNDNNFNSHELNGIILDILVEKEDNFGLLLVPEDNENFFSSINPMLKELGIDNLNVPKRGCFFVKHLGRDNFVLDTEEKNFNMFGIHACLVVPKLFMIPDDTLKKLLVYKNLVNYYMLPKCIKRIVE